MTALVVVQARLGSKRLPGKVLLPLGGRPVLQRVVERCQQSGYPVVVAYPGEGVTPQACELFDLLKRLGNVGRGVISNPDYVLYRYASVVASMRPKPDVVVRVTADCPLVDPALIRAAVQAVESGADYAGNTVERHWPRGLDVEAFTTELLQRAHRNATDPYDREHVTTWMQRHATNPIALSASVRPVEARTEWRWCLDTPEDFEWLTGLYNANGDPSVEDAAVYSRLYPPPVDL